MTGDGAADPSRLLDTFSRLARARDETEVLTALAAGVDHLAPAAMVLSYVHTGADGAIAEAEVARIWELGEHVADHPYYGVRMPAASRRRPDVALTEPIVLGDIVDDLDIAAHAVALGLPSRSFVGLPLFSERHAAYQGAVGLHWYARFSPDADAMRYLRALAPVAAEMIAGTRTLRALRQALALQETLMARSEWALRAQLEAQSELLRVQEAALAERSTPLIPLRDDLLILPLVGTVDAGRGAQILETLVGLGGRVGVRVAIVDVTGVRRLDAAAATVLISAARALRLRGVSAVLTGIQPAAAMTLADLGLDLAGVTLCRTLQDGVALADRELLRRRSA
jgi:anti-anti-sigma regulatory factor